MNRSGSKGRGIHTLLRFVLGAGFLLGAATPWAVGSRGPDVVLAAVAAPSAPFNLVATDRPGGVQLTWQDPLDTGGSALAGCTVKTTPLTGQYVRWA